MAVPWGAAPLNYEWMVWSSYLPVSTSHLHFLCLFNALFSWRKLIQLNCNIVIQSKHRMKILLRKNESYLKKKNHTRWPLKCYLQLNWLNEKMWKKTICLRLNRLCMLRSATILHNIITLWVKTNSCKSIGDQCWHIRAVSP